jgi:hypothetical protein
MLHNTYHKRMAALQHVPAYVSPDQSHEQMPYEKHYRKLHNFRYMYTAAQSQFPGKMINEQILTLRVSLETDIKEIINYYS